MKPTSSEITTSPKAPSTQIGTQVGELGLAGLDLTRVATPDQAAHIKTYSTGFNGQHFETKAARDDGAALADWLARPAPRSWLLSRIAALLSHYFTASTDARVVEAMADDWAATLSNYPAWAVADACRWWISAENERHRFKPLPGEISTRCMHETERLRLAKLLIARFDAANGAALPVFTAPEQPRERVTAERAADILRDVGFSPKRME